MKIELYEILENRNISKDIYLMKLAGDFKQAEFSPGRFLHIKCSESTETLLRRPMSICDVSDDEKTLKFIYRKEGKGTALLSKKSTGEMLDMLAPLGKGFDLNEVKAGKNILLVGGGIGVPPLYYLGRKLKEKGLKIYSILGFSEGAQIFYEKEFSELGECLVCTDDGSYGKKGLVTDFMDLVSIDYLYACGPNPMLKAIQSLVLAAKPELPSFLSVEERMGCGIGACLACICKASETGKERFQKNYLRVCTEGPVFRLNEIVFQN